MSWERHFPIKTPLGKLNTALEKARAGQGVGVSHSKVQSNIPEIYTGHPMRVERYKQYDQMDADGDINVAMDIIATFCTQVEERTKDLFDIKWLEKPTTTDQDILRTELRRWTRKQGFRKRLWRMVRSTLVYGDQFFIRDPETLYWYWVDPSNIEKIIVNDADGKKPSQYVIRDLDPNLQTLTATAPTKYNISTASGVPVSSGAYSSSTLGGSAGVPSSSVTNNGQNSSFVVDAKHVIHLSLSEGLDANWPFGTSLLESVFQTWRQKTLISDAVIIYRLVRAPERRVFYIDVGGMPPHRAGQYVERVKNEFMARRFAGRGTTQSGQSGSYGIDSTYNPQSMTEDFFFGVSDSGRQSRVETLPGGENVGQINDLEYWTNQMLRQLRVPASYMPSSPGDTGAVYVDGRVGTAYIQEFNFAVYCERLQNLLIETFDSEFKNYLSSSGLNMPDDYFDLIFNPPQHFSQFAQIERDSAQMSVLAQAVDMPFFSREFILERFGNLTQEEIKHNMILWAKENIDKIKSGDKLNLDAMGGGGGGGLGGLGGGGGPMGDGDAGLDSVGVKSSELNSETDDLDMSLDSIPGEDEPATETP